jgi:hypothetical protein
VHFTDAITRVQRVSSCREIESGGTKCQAFAQILGGWSIRGGGLERITHTVQRTVGLTVHGTVIWDGVRADQKNIPARCYHPGHGGGGGGGGDDRADDGAICRGHRRSRW